MVPNADVLKPAVSIYNIKRLNNLVKKGDGQGDISAKGTELSILGEKNGDRAQKRDISARGTELKN
ncbi:MAG: hypothetical protein LBE14_01715 [Treponema sp.]|nr:hypothetical protein [Treponema sp.]